LAARDKYYQLQSRRILIVYLSRRPRMAQQPQLGSIIYYYLWWSV